MRLHRRLLCATLSGFVLGAAMAVAQDVKTFPSYQAAASALFEATKSNDKAALRELLGSNVENLLSSGDATEDENARASFVRRYQESHAFVHDAPGKVTLTVGPTGWPLPIPIVQTNGAWHFDAAEGAQELVYRRIGRNELDSLKVLAALYAAERKYAAKGHDGGAPGAYAGKFVSTPGKQDGLYWETKEGEAESPAGSLVARATDEGYAAQRGKKTPFHGYYYRILKSQGAHAPGGAKEYEKDGRMTGGFAIVAYPAEYGASGVMTFLMSPHGTIYQKDLGQGTAEAAAGITTYDPDSSWKLAH